MKRTKITKIEIKKAKLKKQKTNTKAQNDWITETKMKTENIEIKAKSKYE